jgi:SPP1 family predicted phage head-tail adaptor
MIEAGSLRYWVTLEARSLSIDEGGGRPRTFAVVGQFWADIRPANSRESYIAGQRGNEISHIIEARWFPNLTTEMRIVYGTQVFAVVSFRDPEMRQRRLLIECIERKDLDTKDRVPVVPKIALMLVGVTGIPSAEAFGGNGAIA